MRAKWIYAVLFFLGAMQVKAQLAPRNWKDLAAAMDALGKDSTLSDNCRANMRAFRTLIMKLPVNKPDAKTGRQLLAGQSVFTKTALRDSCDDPRIRDITAAFSKLLGKLKTVSEPKKDEPKIKIDSPIVKPAPLEKPVNAGAMIVKRDSVRIVLFPDTLQMGLLKKDIHSLRQINVFLYVCLLLLLALSAAGLWLMGRIYRQLRVLQASGAGGAPMGAERAARPEVRIAGTPVVLTGGQPAVIEDLQPEAPVVTADLPAGTGFICEMMMTAGPRKKFMSEEDADKDLGEDVCGSVSNTDWIGLWLLDGTSDQHCLKHPLTGKEYFSSRLLAQYIGERLRKEFTAKDADGHALDRIMQEAIEGVRTDWVKALHELPEDEKSLLKKNIQRKNFPECASTLLVAGLSLKGELTVYRSGDSKMLLFGYNPDETGAPEQNIPSALMPVSTSLTSKNPESNDRIFFRIVLDQSEELDILCNKPAYELMRQERINTLIAFSDGIGHITEQSLQMDYYGDPDSVRRQIITHSQGTADDKSICFIRIR